MTDHDLGAMVAQAVQHYGVAAIRVLTSVPPGAATRMNWCGPRLNG